MKTNAFAGRYSCGAIYVAILNNPRHKRFLREETILVCVIPGPAEPLLEQLNAVIEPFADEILLLGDGEQNSMPLLSDTDAWRLIARDPISCPWG
jgi:hypothetical protein